MTKLRKHSYIWGYTLGALLIVVITSSANAGWKDIFGCNRDHADPCGQCTHSEKLEYWPGHKERLEEVRYRWWSDYNAITYKFGKIYLDLDFASDMALLNEDYDRMEEVENQRDVAMLREMEALRSLSKEETMECRAIFSDRY